MGTVKKIKEIKGDFEKIYQNFSIRRVDSGKFSGYLRLLPLRENSGKTQGIFFQKVCRNPVLL